MTDNTALYELFSKTSHINQAGVGLYVSNDLDFKNRDDKSAHINEVMKTLLKLRSLRPHGKNVIVVIMYRLPNQNVSAFVDTFSEVLAKA